jgi:hypothetical protein
MTDLPFVPDVPSSDPVVVHQPDLNRFENHTNGQTCVVSYQLDEAACRMVIDHTWVPPALEGRGIAAALVRTALDWAAERGLQVVPVCSYVAVYMRRHPHTLGLLQPRG